MCKSMKHGSHKNNSISDDELFSTIDRDATFGTSEPFNPKSGICEQATEMVLYDIYGINLALFKYSYLLGHDCGHVLKMIQ